MSRTSFRVPPHTVVCLNVEELVARSSFLREFEQIILAAWNPKTAAKYKSFSDRWKLFFVYERRKIAILYDYSLISKFMKVICIQHPTLPRYLNIWGINILSAYFSPYLLILNRL